VLANRFRLHTTVDPHGPTSHKELPREPGLLFSVLEALLPSLPRRASFARLLALSCNCAKLEVIPVKTSGEVF
jgi:hypothetical protein